jgi:mannose-6-phosphate isomerase
VPHVGITPGPALPDCLKEIDPESMTDVTIYPYILQPKLTTAIWGGDALVKIYGKAGDPNVTLGESWECWDENSVENGPLAGARVSDLRNRLGSALLGDLDATRIFPILTKIIDARDWLSVQVHPDDAYAQRVEHQSNGKTECWYILAAQANAELVLGWTRDTDRAEYERRVADGTLGEILRHVPVKPGESFYLPAGMLHAIGEGIVLFETQQASDLTYRIFDWNRVGPDGKPRELHVDKAADVLDYQRCTRGAADQIDYTFNGFDRTALIVDAHFAVERVTAKAEPASLPTQDRPMIVMTLNSTLELLCEGGRATLSPYQTALVPAAANWVSIAGKNGNAAFMLVTPPHSIEAYASQLLAAGVDQGRLDAFVAQF